jgi:hypothetical protein
VGLISGLQLANIGGLLLGLLAPLLILAYLKRRTANLKIVSSTLILKQLSRRRPVTARVKLPPRFWAELAALLLLTLAAALPQFDAGGKSIALILDNSLSMQAGNSARIGDRFSDAKKSLVDFVQDQDSSSTFNFYVTSPRLKRVSTLPLSAGEVEQAINKTKISDAPDSLPSSLLEVAQSGKFDLVVGATDQRASFNEEKPVANRTEDNAQPPTSVRMLPVGDRAANFFVQNANIRGNEIRAAVALSAAQSSELTVSLFASNLPSAANDISRTTIEEPAFEKIGQQKIKVSSQSPLELAFNLPAGNRGAKIYRLEVAGPSEQNALTIDDNAYLAEAGGPASAILLISPLPGTGVDRGLGLSKISAFQVAHISPEQFTVLEESDLNRFAIAIFHRCAPATSINIPSLFILPPAGNRYFPLADVTDQSGAITSWIENHPITSYLQLDQLKPRGAVLLDAPAWAQSILTARSGSLLVAGESRGVRFAAVGFELLPFEGAVTPASSILTLNVLNWLTSSGAASLFERAHQTGTTLKLPADRSWSIISPSGKKQQLGFGDAQVQYLLLEEPGFYRMQSVDRLGNKRGEMIGVNSFFRTESATFEEQLFSVNREYPRSEVIAERNRPLFPLLAAIALLILGIESVVLARSSEAGKEAAA